MSGFDSGAVMRAAVSGLCWVVPATLANAAARSAGVDALVLLCFLLIMAGFAFAGYAAAREAPESPLVHAAAAGFLTFLVVQGVLVVVTIARGDTPSLPGISFLALLAACTGMLGGLVAVRGLRAAR